MNKYLLLTFSNDVRFKVLFRIEMVDDKIYPVETLNISKKTMTIFYTEEGYVKWKWSQSDTEVKPVKGYLNTTNIDDEDMIIMDFNNDKEALLWLKLN